MTGLHYWYWNNGCEGKPFREVEKAACAGNVAHEMAEAFILGEDPQDVVKRYRDSGTDPELIKQGVTGFEGFGRWFRQSNLKLIDSELAVVSECPRYAGTMDGLAETPDGDLEILDWKTSNRIYGKMIAQVAAYGHAFEHGHPHDRERTVFRFNEPITGGHIIRFGKDYGTFAHLYLPRAALDVGWQGFAVALEAYEIAKKLKKIAGA